MAVIVVSWQVGQLELKELTAASLDKLLDGHKALQAQQRKLYEGQDQMESSLKNNLQRLSQEKALIASGQELVAQLIQGITQRMGKILYSLNTGIFDREDWLIDLCFYDMATWYFKQKEITKNVIHTPASNM